MKSNIAPNPSKIVLESVLFFDIDFLSILTPCWEVLGEVLGGFGHPREGTKGVDWRSKNEFEENVDF